MPRFLRPETAFFLLTWVLLLVAFRSQAFFDPGALWHVRVGDTILADRAFMRTDPFTYTYEGHTWIPQQWGGELALAAAHRVGGFDTMLLGFATLIALLFTWIFSRMRAGGMSPVFAGVLTSAALCVGGFHFFLRPHLATIALLGWTMGCVMDFDRGRVGVGRLAWLVPVFVVWTNVHGGVLGGIMTLGLAVAGWGLLFLLKQDSPVRSWRTAWLLVAVVVACGLTPLVNPFGWEMIHTWRKIVGSTAMPEMVPEHAPLRFDQAVAWVIVGFGALYVFLLAGTLPARPRVAWLLPLVWLVLAVKSIRHGPLFAVTAAVALADLWPHTVWHRLLKKHGDSLVTDPLPEPRPTGPGSRWAVLPALAVLAALGLQAAGVPAPVVGRGWARLDPDMVPGEAMTQTLREYAADAGPGAKIFNDPNLGGYLIYHAPGLKIFADDRFELWGRDRAEVDAALRDYFTFAYEHPERIEGMADRDGFTRALVMTFPADHADPPKFEAYLKSAAFPGGRPRWREVARDKRAVLFERLKDS